MARPRKLNDTVLAQARERLRVGVPMTQVAADIGCSARGLQQALDRAAETEPEPDTSASDVGFSDLDTADLESAAAQAGISLEDTSPDAIRATAARQALAAIAAAEAMQAAGEYGEARKQRQEVARFLVVLRQVNAQTPPGQITISAEEMKAVRDRARAKLLAAAETRPMLCAGCSTALSIKWGRGES